jgi:hypothetical protein
MKMFQTMVLCFYVGFGLEPICAQVPFYQDKTINVILGGPPAGSADLRTRAVINVLRSDSRATARPGCGRAI